MTRSPLLCLPLLVSGCSLLPSHDPSQAWVDLNSREHEALQATQVDEKDLEDDRYFQITPGKHELEVRFSFEVDPSNIGPDSQALPRTCLLTLDYDAFTAGERYRLQAGSRGFRPWAQLYNAQGERLARAREGRCGEV